MAFKKYLLPLNQALHVLVALVATFPVALYAVFIIGKFQPLGAEYGIAIGYLALLPLWLTLICFVYPIQNGAKSFALCGLATLVLNVLLKL